MEETGAERMPPDPALPAGGAAPPGNPLFRLLGGRAAAAAIALALVARAVLGVASDHGRGWDFVNFHNTGARAWHGEFDRLYEHGGEIAGRPALGEGTMVYTGFPLSALELAPIGWLPPDPALHLFKLLTLLSYAASAVVLYPWFRERAAGVIPDRAQPACWLLLLLAFEPIWFTLRIGGQTTAFAALGVAVFLRAFAAGRMWLAAAACVFAVMTKPFLGLGVVVLLVAGERVLVARCALLGLGACAASLLAFGLDLHVEWMRVLMEESGRWQVRWTKNAAPLALWNALFLAPRGWPLGSERPELPIAAGHVLFKIAVVALAVLGARRIARGGASSGERRTRVVLLALLTPLVFSTVVWSHYVALALPVLVGLLVAWPRLPRSGRLLALLAWIGLARANWTLISLITRDHAYTSIPAAAAVSAFGSLTLLALALCYLCHWRPLLSGGTQAAGTTAALRGATSLREDGRTNTARPDRAGL